MVALLCIPSSARLPDGMTAQFFVKVETDFDDTIAKHQGLLKTEIEFLKSL